MNADIVSAMEQLATSTVGAITDYATTFWPYVAGFILFMVFIGYLYRVLKMRG